MIATEPTEDWPTRLRSAAVSDVYEVRAMVEVQAARLAAARRTEADVTALRATLARRRRARRPRRGRGPRRRGAAGQAVQSELDATFTQLRGR